MTSSGNPCELEGHANTNGATGAQEHLAQGAGGDLCQFPGQINGNAVGIAAGAKGEPVELILDCPITAGLAKPTWWTLFPWKSI